jgi:hypothetical protein
MSKTILGCLLRALLSGYITGIATSGAAAPKGEPSILIIQVCLRSDFARKSIGVQTVKHASTGTGGQSVTGTTESGQPVFETFTAPVPELQALLVTLQNPNHYYFQPPTNAATGSWTEWQAPSATAKDGNWGVAIGMVNGIRPILQPVVEASAPMMRYRLMTFSAYLDGVRRRANFGQDANIPSC